MRKCILYALFMLATVIPLSAKKKGGNEVILVGKVTVVSNLNMDFIARSRRLTQEDMNTSDMYKAPLFSASDNIDMKIKSSMYLIPENPGRGFKNGEYFCMKYMFPEHRRVELLYIPYFFFNRGNLRTDLPLHIHFDVAEGEKALYIGDFTYTVEGDDFDVTGMQVSYNPADAQAALNAATGTQYELHKADWQYDRKAQIIDYRKVTGSPDNSVVFYGGFTEASSLFMKDFSYIFSEVSPIQLYPDQARTGVNFFVSAPVRPGSTYIMRYWSDYNGFIFTFTEEDSLVTVHVPKEPGLYYFECYDAYTSLRKNAPRKLRSSPSMQKEALEEALKCYKGTVWEEYIQAELDKL